MSVFDLVTSAFGSATPPPTPETAAAPAVPSSPWAHYGQPQVTSLMASINLRRDAAVPYGPRPKKLADMEAIAIESLQSSPAIAKLIALQTRLANARARVTYARQELADAEQNFAAMLESSPEDHPYPGDDIAAIRSNLAEQEALLATIQAAHDKAVGEATRTVADVNQKLRLQQKEYIRPVVEAAKEQMFAALFPLLENVGALIAAQKSVMYAPPLSLDAVLPPVPVEVAEPEHADADA